MSRGEENLNKTIFGRTFDEESFQEIEFSWNIFNFLAGQFVKDVE